MAREIDDGGKVYTIEAPQKEGVPGYIGGFLKSFADFRGVIRSPEFTNEPIRIYYLAETIISQIPNEKKRQEIRNELDNRYNALIEKEKVNNHTDTLNDTQKNHCLVIASIRAMGNVTDFTDKHIGVDFTNKVGFVRAPGGRYISNQEDTQE